MEEKEEDEEEDNYNDLIGKFDFGFEVKIVFLRLDRFLFRYFISKNF